jgi:hypothetical protein
MDTTTLTAKLVEVGARVAAAQGGRASRAGHADARLAAALEATQEALDETLVVLDAVIAAVEALQAP